MIIFFSLAPPAFAFSQNEVKLKVMIRKVCNVFINPKNLTPIISGIHYKKSPKSIRKVLKSLGDRVQKVLESLGAQVKFLCAFLENRAPLRRTVNICVRRIEKCVRIAHARITPDP